MKKGYIYILKNPSFPDYVKIGYADDVEERLRQLNSSECIPYAFRVYATYEVSSRLMDKKLHSIIDRLNPNLRSIEEFNGQTRKREFYAMSPSEAYSLLEAIAEINGCTDKLKKWEPDAAALRDEALAEEIIEEAEEKRHANYTFSFWQIPIGSVLIHADNPQITCKVISDRKVEYNGEKMFMTPLAKIISGKHYITNGPGYIARHFTYDNELIEKREERIVASKEK